MYCLIFIHTTKTAELFIRYEIQISSMYKHILIAFGDERTLHKFFLLPGGSKQFHSDFTALVFNI